MSVAGTVRLHSRGKRGACADRCADHGQPCKTCREPLIFTLVAERASAVRLERWLEKYGEGALRITLAQGEVGRPGSLQRRRTSSRSR